MALRRHLGHGTLVAYLALFIALGGTSYGVATGSIGSKDIKDNAVRGKDIRRSTVTGGDIAANTLTDEDIAESTLPEVPRSTDSGLLDGFDSTAFLAAGAKAADAELLDGKDAGAFVQGPLHAVTTTETPATLEPGPTSEYMNVTFQSSSSRRYAVWATKPLTYTCSVDPCSADFGLYANGAPLAGSGRRLVDGAGGGGATEHLVMFGVTPELPAGLVKIGMGRSDSTGAASISSSQVGQLMAVALDD